MIVYILGEAHSGKGEASKHLASQGFREICLADPMKRALMDWYGFTEQQLWGESSERNQPDYRYEREVAAFDQGDDFEAGRYGIPDPGKQDFLTPREALQTLGEAMRSCYEPTWIKILLRDLGRLQTQVYPDHPDIYPAYYRHQGVGGGLIHTKALKFMVTDVRHINELEALKAQGARGFRITSPHQGKGLTGKLAQHRSETEQRKIPNEALDAVIHNDGTIEQLHQKIDLFLKKIE